MSLSTLLLTAVITLRCFKLLGRRQVGVDVYIRAGPSESSHKRAFIYSGLLYLFFPPEDMDIGYPHISAHTLQLPLSPHPHQDLVNPSISIKLRFPVGDSLVAGDSGTLLCNSFSTSFFS